MINAVQHFSAEGYKIVSPEAMYGRGSRLGSGEARYDGGYYSATVEEFFGGDSSLEVVPATDVADLSLIDAPLFQSLVVVTLVAYLYMLLRSWHFIGSIWGGVFTGSSERFMASMGGELPLQRFKLLASSIGLVLFALVVVRLSDSFVDNSSPIYISGMESVASLVAILLVVVVVAWFYSLHKVVGWVAHTDVASQLSAIGYIDFVRAVVLLYPLVVVWLLSDTTTDGWSRVAVLVGVALLVILYIKDTFLFFIEKKIPILYWILYLCTAILLPASFLAHLIPERLW